MKSVMRFSRIRMNECRGTAIIEMALVSLLLFALIIGIVDVGRAVFAYNTISAVTRDATRHAIVHGARSSSPVTATDIQDYVQNKLIGFNGVNVSTTWTPSNRRGHKVRVTVDYAYQPVVALFPSVQLSATSQMAMSY